MFRKSSMEKGTQLAVSDIEVALLTGGFDRPYALGLSRALVAKGVKLDVIGSKELDGPEMHEDPRLTFLDLYGDQRRRVAKPRKILQHIVSYGKLIWYTATAKPRVFHILWNNKFKLFDRTILMLYYKMLGKRIAFTAHNVNAGLRDGNDSTLNRLSLKAQYRLVDHIFVHTDKMKQELLSDFGIKEERVSVIPFGINNSVPDRGMSPAEAKRKIGVESSHKVILFFGGIRPYKGLEYLVQAFQKIAPKDQSYRLVIAGEPKKEAVQYWKEIERAIESDPSRDQVIREIKYIADEDTEVYFKAADVLVLPYTLVFQSGVLFLSYSFGLPVVATDVGSLRDDIIEGETGYLCHPCNVADLATALEEYFESSLYKELDSRRARIKDFAERRNSWDIVSETTRGVYTQILACNS